MVRCTIIPNGPYQVDAGDSATQQIISPNAEGNSWDYVSGRSFPLPKRAFLCRCGHSQNAPFCDGSHQTAPVDLTEHASREPLLANAARIDGPNLVLTDNEAYCAFARFCDAGTRVWNEVTEAGADHEVLTAHMVHRCPGGRLQLWDRASGELLEPPQNQSIGLIEDPAEGCSGPIMLLGRIEVVGGNDQSYEVRDRQALCRCGMSANKPFCDGSHASVRYNDGFSSDA